MPNSVSTPATSDSTRRSRHGRWGLVALGAVFLSVNFLLPLLLDKSAPPPNPSGLLVVWMIGILVAEPVVLLTWLVFGAGSFRLRASLFVLAGAALVSAWFLSMSLFFFDEHISLRRQYYQFDLAWIPLTPVIALAASIPMYFWRLLAGWRLARDESRPSSNNFSIRGAMLFTGVVALLLALAQWTVAAGGEQRLTQVWMGLGIYSGIAALFVAMLVLPLLVLTMKAGRYWLRGIGFLVISGVLINAVGAIVLAVTEQRRLPNLVMFHCLLVVAYTGFSVIMMIFIASLRRLGFQATRVRTK